MIEKNIILKHVSSDEKISVKLIYTEGESNPPAMFFIYGSHDDVMKHDGEIFTMKLTKTEDDLWTYGHDDENVIIVMNNYWREVYANVYETYFDERWKVYRERMLIYNQNIVS